MSEPDARDPLDEQYVRAESALDDDAARAARRARVLAAVAQARPEPAPARPAQRSQGFHPGWAAAAVVVLSLGVATVLPKTIAPPSPATRSDPVAPPPPVAAPPLAHPAQPAVGSGGPEPQASESPTREALRPPAPPPRAAEPPPTAVPPPPPLPISPVQRSAPAPQAGLAPDTPPSAPSAPAPADEALAQSPPSLAERRAAPSPAGAPGATAAARLRAAAAAGRTAEVEALLAQGVPVDAADLRGDTALMRSVREDHPATAALLRRRGADPDRTNTAGESAAAMAAARNDPRLEQALKPPR